MWAIPGCGPVPPSHGSLVCFIDYKPSSWPGALCSALSHLRDSRIDVSHLVPTGIQDACPGLDFRWSWSVAQPFLEMNLLLLLVVTLLLGQNKRNLTRVIKG